jgi:peroxiredoxin
MAPGFTLSSAQSGTISLADYRSHKAVLLYFSMGPG